VTSAERKRPDGAILLPPGGGRRYEMGAMHAVFKADEEETAERYSVSEWWLDPRTAGPGAHAHDANDEVFYALEGTASIRIGDEWVDAPAGTFVMIPAGVVHDFENRTDHPAGLLNFFTPGGFERNMPAIVRWFAENR
jgi:mannose-6-phosphate isomerase-like protein (cupin superfamily)